VRWGLLFRDRTEAGRMLARELAFLRGKKGGVVVLAIPRGGAVVAKEVADALEAPLDLVITRKIGAPGNPELAIGAVTQDGEVIEDTELVGRLGVREGYVRDEAAKQVDEISRRMMRYRGDRPYPSLAGKTVVVVDDGIATGSTIRAAIQSVRRRKAATIILAVPVGPLETVDELANVADRVVCLQSSKFFNAVGQFYQDFDQVEDATVKDILRIAR
jgi:putative phosphoribosyl transferase